jgi:flagellar protein FlaG
MDIQSLSSVAVNPSKLESTQKAPVDEVKAQESSVVSPKKEFVQETKAATQDEIDAINAQLESLSFGMMFSVDENTQSSIIKLIDKTTDEVIKQFPSEGSLKIMQHIQSYLDSVKTNGLQSTESLTGTLFSEII